MTAHAAPSPAASFCTLRGPAPVRLGPLDLPLPLLALDSAEESSLPSGLGPQATTDKTNTLVNRLNGFISYPVV
jgi:hypothetical protein